MTILTHAMAAQPARGAAAVPRSLGVLRAPDRDRGRTDTVGERIDGRIRGDEERADREGARENAPLDAPREAVYARQGNASTSPVVTSSIPVWSLTSMRVAVPVRWDGDIAALM
jgi:hypothetical protein